jgi:hypothetical protein
MNVDLEVSHFNSFYEIPKLKVKSPLPEVKEGNFIVNGRGDGLFILSPDFKTLLRHIDLPQSLNHQVHDAQILEDGRLLIFNNLTKESNSLRPISSIQEIDLAKNKIIFEFTGTPKGVFYTKVGGAVQKLILVIKGIESKETLERWAFDCEMPKENIEGDANNTRSYFYLYWM